MHRQQIFPTLENVGNLFDPIRLQVQNVNLDIRVQFIE